MDPAAPGAGPDLAPDVPPPPADMALALARARYIYKQNKYKWSAEIRQSERERQEAAEKPIAPRLQHEWAFSRRVWIKLAMTFLCLATLFSPPLIVRDLAAAPRWLHRYDVYIVGTTMAMAFGALTSISFLAILVCEYHVGYYQQLAARP